MTPEKTYAIIVGIESYRLPQSDLDGPGEDAVEFVKWLRNNGVPASNIFLFLSLLEKNVGTIQARLRSVGIDVVSQPAIRTLIENCLKELGNPITYSGELLYLFWGGHGIADEMNNRYLFYSDVTETSLNWHLDVPSWLGLLKSYAHLPTQIVYIDACANLKPNWNLGSNKIAVPPRNARQSVFFAAAIGQRAANQSVLRSGKFSRNLREVIL